jgi:hypothetical protein
MAYDREGIVRGVEKVLIMAPATTLTQMSLRLRVDRHTIERALKDASTSYRELRARVVLGRFRDLRSSPPA